MRILIDEIRFWIITELLGLILWVLPKHWDSTMEGRVFLIGTHATLKALDEARRRVADFTDSEARWLAELVKNSTSAPFPTSDPAA